MNPLSLVGIAEAVAALSKDPSTKVGALIIGPANEIRATGWNGFPRDVSDDPARWHDKPTKYKFVVHAEVNAICNAARSGVSTEGCSLLVTALHPCNECAKAIVQAGIRKVYAPLPEDEGRWATSFEVAGRIFGEAGVIVEFYTEGEGT
jgi:dCMP deaminase